MARVNLAHPDEAQVGQVGLTIRVAARQGLELGQVFPAVKGERSQALPQHREDQPDALEMKGRLSQHGFASQQWFGDSLGDPNCPLVVPIAPIREGNEKAGIGDPLHGREKPFRSDRSFGPRTAPASRMKLWVEAAAFARWS